MANNKYTELYQPPCRISETGEFNNSKKYWEDVQDYLRVGLDNEQAFLRSQRAWRKAEASMSILYGDAFAKDFKGLSRLRINKSRRQTREAIANQSDIRQNWLVRTSRANDKKLADQADEINHLKDHWWSELFVDRVVKGAQQFAGGYGTGYVYQWPDYNPITGEIDVIPQFLDYKQVLVGHIPNNNNIEEAYRVDVRLEMPLPQAHAKFPDHIDIIRPDTEVPSRMGRNWDSTKKIFKGILEWSARRKKSLNAAVSNPFPSVNIFMTFVQDGTINESGKTICMGEPGSHWYYEVPSYYNEDGEVNKIGTNTFVNRFVDSQGNEVDVSGLKDTTGLSVKKVEKKRYVDKEDCKLYPFRRLFISCSGGVIYDGPPQWGIGIPPITQVYFDKVAGEFLCFPPTMDSQIIENSVNNIVQSFEDSVVGRINPPIGIDTRVPEAVKNLIKSLGTRGLIGKAFEYSVMTLQKAIVTLIPHEYFQIDSKAFELVAFLQEVQDYLAGTKDFTSQTKLKQIPSDDSQEALLQNMGILPTDQARELESCFRSMGRIWLSYVHQVYTLPKRLRIIGSDALDYTDLDFDPINIAPDTLPEDSRPDWKIMREHQKNFSIYVAPNSVMQQQSYKKKLALLQIKNMQVPITDEMIYEAFVGDGNFQKVKEQFFVEQEEKAKAAAKIQVEVQKIMQTLQQGQGQGGNGQGQTSSIIEQLLAGLQQAAKEGRPATNQEPATLQEKDKTSGGRTTLSTS